MWRRIQQLHTLDFYIVKIHKIVLCAYTTNVLVNLTLPIFYRKGLEVRNSYKLKTVILTRFLKFFSLLQASGSCSYTIRFTTFSDSNSHLHIGYNRALLQTLFS